MTRSRALPFAERLRLLGLLAARAAEKLRAALKWPVFVFNEWRFRQPESLLIAPQDIRTGDPTIAEDIYGGYFAFGGKIVNAHGRSPFNLPPPSSEWAKALHGFGWLRHMRAAESALARANARSLVKEFISRMATPRRGPAWDVDVVARRTSSWLSQSPMLLEGVDHEFYRRFLRVLTKGYWLLQRRIDSAWPGEARLNAAIAMTTYALCAQGGASLLKKTIKTLNDQLSRQILPDGGATDRNPQTLVDLLFDLLPLRQAFAARGQAPPPELLRAIDRMIPALRMFRHGDGSLALFNGMGVTAPDRVAIGLSYEETRGQPIFNARCSGYQRLEGGEALILIDAGPPPPPLYSRSAHAGCLSFEFSLGTERIVVNCGNPGPRRKDLRTSARTTAAHSTLSLDDASSCLFGFQTRAPGWLSDKLLSGPRNVPVAREDDAQGSQVLASHDGYLRSYGLFHERRWRLEADGARLTGRDRLIRANEDSIANVDYVIRFHIHPSVTLTLVSDGAAILLETPSGANLVFDAGGLPLAIEESIFFAAPEGPRACEQIVIYGASADIDEIDWSFSLQAAAVPA
ncbi:heparinase II/III family protein [Rhodoblastus acidophilus]|uniref:Heparinase II/III family protein n=1 Tax=Candidatus Rhodoblastus alkanivorans TaxID=2954117 RepID=A0ABS9Z236_9HYPH|nr:heparinase II/III family protein [Candidatus Rhodoblastus alkanivorans]MCI4678128.1 heparinase II/III family protein [Candidatus Rhodoblastus alkanivorans]MCI4681531.1 heparinase II/III family protein [Candidatus Rhodoblastus alkanivorans]MDI4642579.1 heparinase II/III family protein [Rhodoblastus acidophilus]